MFKIGSHISKTALVVLVFVLMITFYGLSRPQEGYLPWHQQIVIAFFSPLQKSAAYLSHSLSGVWQHYFNLVGVERENGELKKQVSEMKMALGFLKELESENQRLASLMAFKERHSFSTLGARVLTNDPRSDFRAVTIDRGERDGVAPNMPVVAAEGLVGRVVEVGHSTAKVLLITDPGNAVDVIIERSRARALLAGKHGDLRLSHHFSMSRLEYLERKSDVHEGDVVVTSGWDGIYPSGLPVGTVADLQNDSSGVFKEADVVPFTDFSRLSEVLVVFQ